MVFAAAQPTGQCSLAEYQVRQEKGDVRHIDDEDVDQ
jgi:hypothetical protein